MHSDAVNGKNNKKGDVIINKKHKIKPMEDLFSDPDFDPTIIESSEDEEMEVNGTIIEKKPDTLT